MLAELGVTDVAVCGLAKRLEEVWLPGRAGPGDPLAHQRRPLPAAAGPRRGAPVRHHLPPAASFQGHDRAPTLDAVPGLGPSRRTALLKHFGSVRKLRAAGVDEIAALPGFGPRTAAAVLAALHGPAPDDRAATAGRRHRPDADRHDRGPRASRRRHERAGPAPEPPGIEVTLVSGLSGAGRSTAAKVLEDLGWFVVDNLPPELIATMVDLGRPRPRRGHPHRGGDGRAQPRVHRRPRRRAQGPRRPRLQAAAAVPRGVRRRAGPPVRAGPAQPPAAGRRPARRRHRRRARAARPAARRAPTSSSTPPRSPCRRCAPMLERAFGERRPRRPPGSRMVSFGYKYGLPMDADLVVDVRFLPNPYWIPELREHTGRDEDVRDYVLSQEGARRVHRPLPGAAAAGRRRVPARGQALPDRSPSAAPAASTAASRSARRSRAGWPRSTAWRCA